MVALFNHFVPLSCFILLLWNVRFSFYCDSFHFAASTSYCDFLYVPLYCSIVARVVFPLGFLLYHGWVVLSRRGRFM